MSNDAQELSDELDLEFFCESEGHRHKLTRGSSGMQIHLMTCPCCDDRKWKVYLNAESGVGNCFPCEARFNKLTFVFASIHGRLPEKGIDSAGWRETFEKVKSVLKDQGWKPKRTTTVAVSHEKVKLPLSFPLPTPEGENLLYLENRGVGVELAKFFHLRFCEDGWWNFTKEDGSPGGQKFDNRIILPVYDLDGGLVTFQGRDITGTSDRKYIFPKGLPGTGKYLFNGQNAHGAKRAVLGEGGFDVIAVKRALDEEVALRDVLPLGSFGKHLSFGSLDGDDQLGRFLMLKRAGLEEVTIMWDGEAKVIAAALDAADKLQSIGLRAKIALLPPDKDPNEATPAEVRAAFYGAHIFTPKLSMMWRLRNPYAKAHRKSA